MVLVDPCRMLRSIAVVLVAVLGLVAGCGEDSDGATAATAGEGEGHEGASPVAEDARHVPVVGRSFEFEPGEITAQVGEDLAIVLTSEDGLHDFTVDELDAHVEAEDGTSVGGLRADEPGRYTFYCSIEGHREAGMEGVLMVEER